MRRFLACLGALVFLWSNHDTASATSISVAPTTVELTAPSSASHITLRNAAKKPVNVQIRVFRWTQIGGQDVLEPTKMVVASPPSIRMAPGQEYKVRIVRISKAPIAGEESYRLFVDELPQSRDNAPGTVALVVRQSIPVFFTQADAGAPKVSWSVGRSGGRVALTGRNDGSMRLKVSDLVLSQGGKSLTNAKGLVGYVLAGSTMTFPIGGKAPTSTAITLQANSNMGPFNAKAGVSNR